MPKSLQKASELTGKPIIFYEVDICDKAGLRSVFTKNHIDCVLHIAALKSVGESCKSPLKYYSINVAGSIHLIEIMEEFGVRKIVFSSSSTVFGEPSYLPIDEDHPTGQCINPYGRTKYFFEEITRDLCKADNVKSLPKSE
jgi:UDP-glucose 4-epimerase